VTRGQGSCLQIQRSGFDSRGYKIFWELMGLKRGPLSLVSKIEELLEGKSTGSDIEDRKYGCRDLSRWPLDTRYPQKLALTSPTGGCLYSSLADWSHGVMQIKPNSVAWGELYRPSDNRWSAKLVSTFEDRGCRVVSVTHPYGQTLHVMHFACVIELYCIILETDCCTRGPLPVTTNRTIMKSVLPVN
jgi:hypothetical protein